MLGAVTDFLSAAGSQWWWIITGLFVPFVFDIPKFFGSKKFNEKWEAALPGMARHFRLGAYLAVIVACFLAFNSERNARIAAQQLESDAVKLQAKIESLERRLRDLTADWRLSDDQQARFKAALGLVSEKFPIYLFAVNDDGRKMARDIASLLHKSGWPYSQPGIVWADPRSVGIRIVVSDKQGELVETLGKTLTLHQIFSAAGIPLEQQGTEQSLPSGQVGLVLGSKPIESGAPDG